MLPAYAGMIPAAVALQIAWEGAPRVCGDDPLTSWKGPEETDVLPAYAGMIRPELRESQGSDRAPRVCGDDPPPTLEILADPSCSPRMRG